MKFHDHRVYIKAKGSDRSLDQVIGIRSRKVYRLHFEPAKALVSSSQGELWHRRMAHFHHEALKHLRQAVVGVPQVHEEKHKPLQGLCVWKEHQEAFPIE